MDNEQSLTEDEFVNDCNIFQAQYGVTVAKYYYKQMSQLFDYKILKIFENAL